jgi:hypothetical protein
MARATDQYGRLQELAKCRITTPYGTIRLKVLPKITDGKQANYVNETIPGRANPVVNYSHSEPRTISSELTFISTTCQDIYDNLSYLRLIESLVYPGPAAGGAPYSPPPVCKFTCGRLLSDGNNDSVCVVLKSYSVQFQDDVAWDLETYLPYRVTVSCQWEVVYACKDLPTNNFIISINTSNWVCPPRLIDQAN